MYNIKSPGDKILELRKAYKIKQHELSGHKVTRNLISLIENNKASLTYPVAEIIVENFNKLLADRDIRKQITISYLMESVGSQANKVIESFIDKVESSNFEKFDGFDNELLNIEKMIKEKDQKSDVSKFYLCISNVYQNEKDFQSQYIYLLRSYNTMSMELNDIKLSKILLKLCSCAIKIHRYEEAIKHSKFAKTYFIDLPSDIDLKFEFNTALAYKKLKQYDKALQSIDSIQQKYPNLEQYQFIQVQTLKANCFESMDYYVDAIKIYKQLLECINPKDIENILVTHCNLIEIYMNLEDSHNIETHVNKSIDNIEHSDFLSNDSNQSIYILIDIAKGLYHIEKVSCSIYWFNLALEASKKANNKKLLLQAMTGLFKAYQKSEMSNNIYDLKTELMELIKFNRIVDYDKLVLKFIGYFTLRNDSNSIMDIVNLLTD